MKQLVLGIAILVVMTYTSIVMTINYIRYQQAVHLPKSEWHCEMQGKFNGCVVYVRNDASQAVTPYFCGH